MTDLLSKFRSVISGEHLPRPNDASLEIDRSGALSVAYAPFEYINPSARVVLVGMTPGAQQANNALGALRGALAQGASDDAALKVAKNAASFSGPMRKNLVAMLDRIGLQTVLGLESCADLFTTCTHLVHFTSALRYPVFVDGKNYTGSPAILQTPFLTTLCERWLTPEVMQLPEAFWVPLGKEAQSVVNRFAARGHLHATRVLEGLPHPSPANAERIAYVLGTKPRARLSVKTNPDPIDAAREKLAAKVAASGGTVASTRGASGAVGLKQAPKQCATSEKSEGRSAGHRDRRADRFAKTFVLMDRQGAPRYPLRDVHGSFVLAPRGANMHHAEFAIHVADEEDAYQMVTSGTYKIRAVRGTNDPASLLGVGDRTISKVVRVKRP